jgi:hypothetical protein
MRSNLNDGSNGTLEDNDLLADNFPKFFAGQWLARFYSMWFDTLTQRGDDRALDDSVRLKTLTRH